MEWNRYLGFAVTKVFGKESALHKDIAADANRRLGESGGALRAVLWDLDGTLIDSEPYWHQAEIDVAREHGGYWNEGLGWACSGKPMPVVGAKMVENGTRLPVDQITRLVIGGVERMEAERLPWIPGVEDVLRSLVAAGIPSVLVTTSPRSLAQNLVNKAPKGAFAGFVCGDDDLPKKPNPAPYLAAAKIVGIDIPQDIAAANGIAGTSSGQSGRLNDDAEFVAPVAPVANATNSFDSANGTNSAGSVSGANGIDGVNVTNGANNANSNLVHADFYREMAQCVAFEDSMTGIRSAAASGATTIAQTGYIKTDTSAGPQFASIGNYDGMTAEVLERYVEQRIAAMDE